MRVRRVVRLLVLGLFTFFLVAACGGNVAQDSTSTGSQPSPTECRMVKHAMGETCIPMNPQRVVVLDGRTLEATLALGVKPTGAAAYALSMPFPPYLEGKVDGIEWVGDQNQPSLEKILQLKPDLIIGYSPWVEQIYDKLSQIAPTVAFEFYTPVNWKNHLRDVAETLGRSEQAEQLIANYEKRLEEFKAAMGNQLDQTKVSLVTTFHNDLRIELKGSFAGTILTEAGLRRPPSQDIALKDNKNVLPISDERIPDLDGDVIFLYASDRNRDHQLRQDLPRNPLWSQLKAVKNDRVYKVDFDYWDGSSVIGANLVLDDLFKYLAQEER